MRWPKEVSIVTEKDVCKGEYTNAKGKHCLRGLAMANGIKYSAREYRVVQRSITELIPKYKGVNPLSISIATANDDPRTTKKMIARVWNRAMAYLGYTEGNPEVRYTKGVILK